MKRNKYWSAGALLAVIAMLAAACAPAATATAVPTAMPADTAMPAGGIDCMGAASGDTVSMLYQWSGAEEERLNSILKPLVDACGITVKPEVQPRPGPAGHPRPGRHPAGYRVLQHHPAQPVQRPAQSAGYARRETKPTTPTSSSAPVSSAASGWACRSKPTSSPSSGTTRPCSTPRATPFPPPGTSSTRWSRRWRPTATCRGAWALNPATPPAGPDRTSSRTSCWSSRARSMSRT